jgi:hypothetical protein
MTKQNVLLPPVFLSKEWQRVFRKCRFVHEDDVMPFNVRCFALEKKYDALEERIRSHNEKTRESAKRMWNIAKNE